MNGAGDSTPISDQVPQERNAQFVEESAGMAATAAPVSCEHEATTSVSGESPVSAAIAGRILPSVVPEATIFGKIFRGMPSASAVSSDHVFVRGL